MTADRHPGLAGSQAFAQVDGQGLPILLAPIAGVCLVALSVAVARADPMRRLWSESAAWIGAGELP